MDKMFRLLLNYHEKCNTTSLLMITTNIFCDALQNNFEFIRSQKELCQPPLPDWEELLQSVSDFLSANTADAHPGVSGMSKAQKLYDRFKNTHCQVDNPAKIE